eukprot:UN16309
MISVWIPDISPKISAELIKRIKKNAIYLDNESHLIKIKEKSIKIYGSPMSMKKRLLKYVAFQKTVEQEKSILKSIPKGTDIILTHGPGIYLSGGFYKGFKSVGSPELSKTIDNIKPKYHVFGHVHEGFGYEIKNKTTHINAT